MSPLDLLQVADAVISSVEPGILSNDTLQKLSALFPDTLLLAALDLIDRDNVVQLRTPAKRLYYQVHGSTATYTVFPDLPAPTPIYCTCPAFVYSVLMAESHLMCKHVLATRLAERLGRCVERDVTAEDMVAILMRQNS